MISFLRVSGGIIFGINYERFFLYKINLFCIVVRYRYCIDYEKNVMCLYIFFLL